MPKQNFKSPLKDKPLRNSGEPIDKQIVDVIFDEVLIYLIISVLIIVITMMEWHHWYFKIEPSPWTHTFLAIISLTYSTINVTSGFKKAKRLK